MENYLTFILEQGMIKVSGFIIENFRAFEPAQKVAIGDRITLIAGQNGTAKSTILGILAQPLGIHTDKMRTNPSKYTDTYHDIDLNKIKAIDGKPFAAVYKNIFRISKQTDKVGKLDYSITLKGSRLNIESLDPVESDVGSDILAGNLKVWSKLRGNDKDSIVRLVSGKKTTSGYGNFPHPVIYLGLQRLMPLCLEKNLGIDGGDLNKEEEKYFVKNYSNILVVVNEIIKPERLTVNKSVYFAGASANRYNSEAISAGQDNVGQIITSIISYKRLKNILGTDYQGGLLLIDEIDASLHAVAQEKILKFLAHESNELDLQIIATTHSLFLLEQAQKLFKKDIKLIHLKQSNGKIIINDNADYKDIYEDLTLSLKRQPKTKDKVNKVSIWFEDKVASLFFRCLTLNIFKKFIVVVNMTSGVPNNFLIQCASLSVKKNVIQFDNTVFILDPDSKKDVRKQPNQSNLLILPGNKMIEEMMYEFLNSLDGEDKIWNDSYTKQMCFRDHNPALLVEPMKDKSKFYKKWFAKIAEDDQFGKDNIKLFKFYVDHNKDICRDFCQFFLKALNKTKLSGSESFDKNMLKNEIDKKFCQQIE